MSRGPADQGVRDQQLGVLLTKEEKEAVVRIARDLGMSMSNAGRYLIRRGLAVHETTINPDLGE